MKLKSFRIANFRSIGSLECNLSGNLIVLAGKNESGKTTILDALTSINPDVEFKETDRPLNKETDSNTTIQYDFELTDEEKERCLKNYQLTGKGLSNDVTIELTADEDDDEFEHNLFGPFWTDVQKKLGKFTDTDKNFVNKNLENINEQLKNYNDEQLSLFQNIDNVEIDYLYVKLQEIKKKIPRNPQNNQSTKPALENVLDEFIPKLDELRTKTDSIGDMIWSMRPKVIKFSSFDDILPATVPYSEFTEENLKANHSIVYDIATLAGIDFEKIQTDDIQMRENQTEKAARITTKKFKEYWNQDQIEFIFRVSEPQVSIFVRDLGKETSFKPEQRSKGLQWFLSFYLRLQAQGREKNNLILIDEPALYLHAKAQQDVLKVLESESNNNQIIFTTHSPYLIDPNELNRVRLVIKDEKTDQTIITSSFYKGGDSETLTPIITAIGLDLSKDLFFSKLLNVVLEGISDYYYLRGMITYLKKNEDYKFPDNISLISSIGNANVSLLVSLLMGLGLPYKIILDKKGSSKIFNKFKRDGIEDEIIMIGKKQDDSIEDLFDDTDREKYELDDQTLGKAAISRRFYEKIKAGDYKDFSPTTINNFRKLLDKIKTHVTVSFEQFEEKIDKLEGMLDEVVELITVTHGLPMAQKEKKELVQKYTKQIKSLTEPSKKQQGEMFVQFLKELEVKSKQNTK